ncbi:hypothetical protein IMZ48_31375 [Candidatus Bathyarchaeota archaeon]|nr:hypothetical protein [Candidatus Bathyarchaeota archaeon]
MSSPARSIQPSTVTTIHRISASTVRAEAPIALARGPSSRAIFKHTSCTISGKVRRRPSIFVIAASPRSGQAPPPPLPFHPASQHSISSAILLRRH